MMPRLDEAEYVKFLGKYKLRPIQTDEENERAIKALEQLHAEPVLSPEREALAEVLLTLIEKFEEERYTLNAGTPAEILRELLQANDLEQKDLAKLIGSKGIASEILSRKRRISRSLAQLFAERFSVPYRIFL